MKNKAQKDILYISISSFILSIAWISFNIYHIVATSTITPDLEIQIKEIDPEFNLETIQKLKNREKIEPIYEFNNTSASSEAVLTPSPSSESTPTATNEAKVELPLQ